MEGMYVERAWVTVCAGFVERHNMMLPPYHH